MDWATIVPVLVGSGVALATSVSVEYLKYRQTTDVAVREREEAVRQQSREGLHTLVTQVQDSLEKMIRLAAKMPGDALSVEEEARLRAEFSDVTLGIVRLVSRLPDKGWRDSVNDVIKLTNRSTVRQGEGSLDEDVDSIWAQATSGYEDVMERVAEPLQKFYKLALNGT
jgi:hypothetical protein